MKKLLLILCLLPVLAFGQPLRKEFSHTLIIKGNDTEMREQKTVIYFDFENLTIDRYSGGSFHFDILDITETENGYSLSCVDEQNDMCIIGISKDAEDGKLMVIIAYTRLGFSFVFYEK